MKGILTASLALAGLGLAGGHGLRARTRRLAIVVKGLDNPFFEQIHLGCEKWNGENAASGYKCLYTGPASSADEAGEVQIVEDLLNRPDVEGDRDLALQRAADGQAAEGEGAGDPGHDHRRRSSARTTRRCARPISAPTII